jgi:hypothetical protein
MVQTHFLVGTEVVTPGLLGAFNAVDWVVGTTNNKNKTITNLVIYSYLLLRGTTGEVLPMAIDSLSCCPGCIATAHTLWVNINGEDGEPTAAEAVYSRRYTGMIKPCPPQPCANNNKGETYAHNMLIHAQQFQVVLFPPLPIGTS